MQTLFDLLGLFRQRILGCCLGLALFFVLLTLACGALGWAAAARAGSAPPDGFDVMLLLDHSNSMWSLNGLGSDPEMLRVAAANLFLSYLGADDPQRLHRAGVIHFGGTSELVVPLTPLDDANRAAIRQRIANPIPIPWTDPAAALALAAAELGAASSPQRRQAILLLSDGSPAWANATAAGMVTYRKRLQSQLEALGEAGVSVFVILLASPATDADPAIQEVWAPFWRQAVALTPRGAFFQAREAQELLGLYHQVVAGLTGGEVGRQIADEAVSGSAAFTFTITPDLARFTLVTWKSDPAVTLAVQAPQDQPLQNFTKNVRYAGQPGASHEEVWTVERPQAGVWTLTTAGAGRIAIWLDVQTLPLSPTPTATATPSATLSPSPTPTATATSMPRATPAPTRTPSPSATPTDTAVLAAPAIPPASSAGQRPLWRGPLLLILLPLIALAAFSLARRRPAAQLEGTLQPIAVPPGVTLPARIDLSAQARRQFSLGQGNKVDLSLSGWEGQAQLQAAEEEGETVVRLHVLAGEVCVGGQPTKERSLHDNDILAIGDYRFRFRRIGDARSSAARRRYQRL